MSESIGWLLNRTSYGWRTVVDNQMRDLGLTQSGWMAMLHLHRLGEGCSQKVLADNIGIEQPTLQRSINSLHQCGYLERRTSSEDARVRTLWFTEQGRTMLSKMEVLAAEARLQMLQGLDEDERAQLACLLKKVLHNANSSLRKTYDQ